MEIKTKEEMKKIVSKSREWGLINDRAKAKFLGEIDKEIPSIGEIERLSNQLAEMEIRKAIVIAESDSKKQAPKNQESWPTSANEPKTEKIKLPPIKDLEREEIRPRPIVFTPKLPTKIERKTIFFVAAGTILSLLLVRGIIWSVANYRTANVDTRVSQQWQVAVEKTQAKLEKAQAKLAEKAEALQKTITKLTIAVEKLTMAIALKGDGIQHCLIRQLVDNPEEFGLKGNQQEVKKRACEKAHQLAILGGYVDQKTGQEIRIRNPGIAYRLVKVDGEKIQIQELTKGKNGQYNLANTQNLAASYAEAKLKSPQNYEYVFSPSGH